MKKFAVLLFAVALLYSGCPTESDDTDNEPGLTVDSRLVGGKWYDRTVGTDKIYYEFTANSYTSAYNGPDSVVTTPAYTRNGNVYGTGTDLVMLSYEIVSGTEYDAVIEAAKDEVLRY
jgi:hypothetical protein